MWQGGDRLGTRPRPSIIQGFTCQGWGASYTLQNAGQTQAWWGGDGRQRTADQRPPWVASHLLTSWRAGGKVLSFSLTCNVRDEVPTPRLLCAMEWSERRGGVCCYCYSEPLSWRTPPPSGHQSRDWTVLGVGLGPWPIHKSLLWMEVPGGSGCRWLNKPHLHTHGPLPVPPQSPGSGLAGLQAPVPHHGALRRLFPRRVPFLLCCLVSYSCLKIQFERVKLVARAGDIGPLRQDACDGEQGSQTRLDSTHACWGTRHGWSGAEKGLSQPVSVG